MKSLRARVGQYHVTLFLRAKSGSELELWALSKEADYFLFVFGRTLSAEVS